MSKGHVLTNFVDISVVCLDDYLLTKCNGDTHTSNTRSRSDRLFFRRSDFCATAIELRHEQQRHVLHCVCTCFVAKCIAPRIKHFVRTSYNCQISCRSVDSVLIALLKEEDHALLGFDQWCYGIRKKALNSARSPLLSLYVSAIRVAEIF